MSLRQQRGRYKASLTKTWKAIEQNDFDEAQLREKLKYAQESHKNILALHNQIVESLKDEASKAEEDDWLDDYKDFMSTLHTLIQKKLHAVTTPKSQSAGTSAQPQQDQVGALMSLVDKLSSQHADMVQKQTELMEKVLSKRASSNDKLPSLDIPKFDGSYRTWVSFRDLYTASIHNNDSLKPSQKLQYLQGLLTKQAASAIRNITVSDANYEKAWAVLTNRFEKRHCIVSDHIQTFLSIPKITHPDKTNVREAFSIATEVTQALDALKCTSKDPWLIHLLNERMDSETRNQWADKRSSVDPTWQDYLDFLEKRCDIIDECSSSKNPSSSKADSRPGNNTKKKTALVATEANRCKCCNGSQHPLYKCQIFTQKSPSDRLKVVKNSGLCWNCLSSSHETSNCTSTHTCKQCHASHNTLLHAACVTRSNITSNSSASQNTDDIPGANSSSDTPEPAFEFFKRSSNIVAPTSVNISSAKSSVKVFLATCSVNVFDAHRNVHRCRAVLDNGAQQSMITESLRDRLQLQRCQDNTVIMGVSGKCSKVKGRTTLLAQSASAEDIFEFNCLIMPQVTGNLPNFSVNPSSIPIPPEIQLSDPNWCRSSQVDLLIGMDYFNDVLQDGIIRLGPQQPVLRETVFGWILSGVLHEPIHTSLPQVQCNLSTISSLENTLKKFWEVEEVETVKPQTIESAEVEQHFVDTHSRDEKGRFIVHLPLKSTHTELGYSRGRAIRQLKQLEVQLDKNPEMRTLYNNSMQEYLDKGYMNEVFYKKDDENHFYLPHHGVWKPSSTTTKLRVVFNASAKTSSGISLNDVLKIGATVQPELVTILLRFRMHPYAMSCDVTKMYLQVKLHPPHADFQRIVWRSSSDMPLQDYKINRVCFGVASSPFLATRVLNELATVEQNQFPLGSQVVKNCFYIDDGLISCDSLEVAQQTQNQLIQLMQCGGFSLAKWSANHPSLLENITNPSSEAKQISISDDSVSVLGLKWNPQGDSFQFVIPPNFAVPLATRTSITSAVARIFDPLGLLGPIITIGKILIQASWTEGLDWTTPLPPELQEKWTKFINTLPQLNEIIIPRWASNIPNPTSAVIHGFADASKSAYGAAVYLVTDDGQSFSSHLLISKSRVAPTKNPLTIPKLELCAAELCANLVSRVQRDLSISQAFLWSDSTIVLAWIESPPSQKHEVFVNNRLKKIRKVSSASQWAHVSSEDNPADLISRGCTPETLLQSDLWFCGPSWLGLHPSHYLHQSDTTAPEQSSEITVNLAVPKPKSLLQRLLGRCSRIFRLEGIIAQCLRFLTPSSHRAKGPLTVSELDKALLHLIRLDQQEHFGVLINSLKKGDFHTNKHCKSFANLQPFLDSTGLIRVGGRLQHSPFTYDAKHPILLANSALTKLIAEREHSRNLHCGPQALLAAMRQRFWPIRGRHLVRGIYRKCIRCFRFQPRLQQQIMGQLPEHRTTFSKPFTATSVDFAGPLQMRPHLKRGGTTSKVWIAIFVCHITKAMHIELVSNLSTEAFVAAFRRFVARRSAPQHLYLDNATNFTGTSNELSRLLAQESSQRALHDGLLGQRVQFHFQPPEGPHHNGLVEAAVKSVKIHLSKIVGSCPLTFEELQTVLTQIEAVLNSRPIMPLSSDPSDPPHLTPGHFLTGGPLTALPDPDLEFIPMNRLSRWQLCQRLSQQFAARWKRDYVHHLQERTRWKSISPNVKVGDLALLAKDNVPSIQWQLGEIVNVCPGPDNHVRVVDIRTRSGVYRRPVTKIALLPMEQETPEDVGAQTPTDTEFKNHNLC
ncbi:uncharacterized protein LOC129809241 [Phlebotomus papatasi]|uniref:uncharacterized protein LOC129809241 n=1 Tax=Phlebotomus papatasi TaxID=29031 RepID=UPI0024834288|nr:uncharacterized protein LOC129809241 [Phlebotomus papatasi]